MTQSASDEPAPASDQEAMPGTNRPPLARSRTRRAFGILVRLGLALAALGMLLGVLAARNLGHPLVKGVIAGIADRVASADVDLEDGALGLESLTLYGLRVRHPAADDARVGDLLRLDRLEVRWRLEVLARSEWRLDRVDVEGLALGLVLGGEGGSSLARAVRLPESPPRTEPLRPSRWLQTALQPLGAAVDALHVGPTTLAVALFADPQARLEAKVPALDAELDFLATPARWKAQVAGAARLSVHAGTLADVLTAQAIAALRGLEAELAAMDGKTPPTADVGIAARLEHALRPPWQQDALIVARVAPLPAGPGAGIGVGVDVDAPTASGTIAGATPPPSPRWLTMQVELTQGAPGASDAVPATVQLGGAWALPLLGVEASAQVSIIDATQRDALPTATLTRADARLLRRAAAAELAVGPIALKLGAGSAAEASVAAWPLWPWWTPGAPAATGETHAAPSARFDLTLPTFAVGVPAIAIGLPAEATGTDGELRASVEGLRAFGGATLAGAGQPAAPPRVAVRLALSLAVDAAALSGAGALGSLRNGGASGALEVEVAQTPEGPRWVARSPPAAPAAPNPLSAAPGGGAAPALPEGPGQLQVARLELHGQDAALLPLAGTMTDLRCELADLAADVTAGSAGLERFDLGCVAEALSLRATSPALASSLEVGTASVKVSLGGAALGLAAGDIHLHMRRLRAEAALACPQLAVRGQPVGLRRLRAEATLNDLDVRGANAATAQLMLAQADLAAEGEGARTEAAACDPLDVGEPAARDVSAGASPADELRTSLALRQLTVAANAPDALTVSLRGEIAAPGAKAAATLTIADTVEWQAELEVGALRRALANIGVAPTLLRAAGALAAATRGRVKGHRAWLRAALGLEAWPAPDSLRLQHRSQLRLQGLSAAHGATQAALEELLAEAEGEGGGLRQTQQVKLAVVGMRVGSATLPPLHLQAEVATRATAGTQTTLQGFDADVRLDAAGQPALAATLSLTKGQPWRMEAETTLHPVGALARRLALEAPCPELGRIGANAKGAVRIFAPDTWAPGPLLAFFAAPQRWHFDADVEGTVRDLRCHLAGFDADTPEVRGRLEVEVRAGQVHTKVEGSLERLRTVVQAHAFDWRKLRGQAEISAPLAVDLRGAHINAKGQLGSLRQDLLPFYAVEDATAAVTAEIDARGRVRVERMVAQNKGGGSGLRLEGVIDRIGDDAILGALGDDGVPGSRGVALRGEASQDLDALGEAFGVRLAGRVRLPFEVESGDLRTFALALRPQLDGVSAQHARLGLAVREVRGVMPVTLVVRVDESGIRPLGGGELSAWSRWRFADHHPFVSGEHFVSIGELSFRDHRFGPLAANASIDRDVVRLDQMELRLLSGQVTGSCQIELQGADSQVTLRGNATDLRLPDQPGRFDANAAIAIRPWRLAIEGRAQLLRATPNHLRGLLDLVDPYHEDVQANRARLLLNLGHPDEVRLRFRHGFMDLYIALAGLAELVHIDEIRGVPLGPMMARWAVPLLGEPPP